MAFWNWGRRSNELAGMHQEVSGLQALPLAEARSRALAALRDPTHFECREEPLAGGLPAGLPDSAREIFSLYSSVKAVAGEALLSRSQIGPAQYRDGFLRIGTNLDATELAVRPGEEPVYEIDGSDADEREIERGGVPSLYHWVLVTEEVLYGK